MTVCIATICNVLPNEPPMIIAAADRMITIGNIEFEPEQTKAHFFATQTVALMAGSMHVHAHIVPLVQQAVVAQGGEPLLVKDIAGHYAEQLAIRRRDLAERHILTPINMTASTFLARDSGLSERVAIDLERQMQNYESGAAAIIAGIDVTGAHIYVVCDPGIAVPYDTEGFAVIGLGDELARPQFMLARYNRRWNPFDAALLVFSAKRRAEMVSSVGNQTDMFMIRPGQNPPLYQLNESDLKTFGKVFDRQLVREKASNKKAAAELFKYATKIAQTSTPTQTGQSAPVVQPKSDLAE